MKRSKLKSSNYFVMVKTGHSQLKIHLLGVLRAKFLKPKRKKIKTLTEEKHPDPLEVAIELKNLEMVRIIIHFTNFEQDHPKSGSYLHLAEEYENLDVFKTVFEAAKNSVPTRFLKKKMLNKIMS